MLHQLCGAHPCLLQLCGHLCDPVWPSVWSCDHLCGFQTYALEYVAMLWMEVMIMCETHPCCNSVTICVASSFGNFETKSSSINQYLLVTSQWPSPTRFWMDLRDYEFYDVLLWVNKDCQLRALWRERDSETWAIEKWPDPLCRLFWSSGHRGSHLCVAFSLLGCVISSVCCFSDSSTCLAIGWPYPSVKILP